MGRLGMPTHTEKFNYDDATVRKFDFATALWGVVAMLVGLWLALMLVMPQLNFGLAQLSFGRLRPLHTNAAIFAFAGNAIFAAIWFYIATIITVAILHIFNNLALPVSLFKSYSIYGGVQDAFMQWWYGHNAVAFFLTTPFLGLMYYFLPKAANKPVFSYRLSIVHFWSLIFLYIWAGPHHLLYTALPDWAQSLGTVFSVMPTAPSWGGR